VTSPTARFPHPALLRLHPAHVDWLERHPSITSVKAGSPEKTPLAIRLCSAREVAVGLFLRDSASAVVERALQVGLFYKSVTNTGLCGAT
jgi:hypothetical protein